MDRPDAAIELMKNTHNKTRCDINCPSLQVMLWLEELERRWEAERTRIKRLVDMGYI